MEGLKFLAERDMRSLHKVTDFLYGYFIKRLYLFYSTSPHWVGKMFRCQAFGNIFTLMEDGGGLWYSAGRLTDNKCKYTNKYPQFSSPVLYYGSSLI